MSTLIIHPWSTFFEKCLNDTSPHLQCLLLHLNQYQMSVQYVTHKCVPIADCMSWLIDFTTSEDNPSLNLQIADVTRANINWNLFEWPNNDRISSHNPKRMAWNRQGTVWGCQTVLSIQIHSAYYGWSHLLAGQNCDSKGSQANFPAENTWCTFGGCKIQIAWIAWMYPYVLAKLEQ